MCDLLGLTFNVPITAKISLNIFQERGAENSDGWGLAFYTDNTLQIVKEARSAIGSELYDFMERYVSSHTIISHVRRSTRGIPSYLNTHPFYRRCKIGSENREIAFAHNGTLTQHNKLRLREFTPIGETDSEHLMCHLLDAISTQVLGSWEEDDFAFIEHKLREINQERNTLNCIFSDGSYLFCYSDVNDHNNGLRFVKQEQPFRKIELSSPEAQLGFIDISTDKKSAVPPVATGYIISTRILTNEPWTEFNNGELIIFDEGRIVYPHNRA